MTAEIPFAATIEKLASSDQKRFLQACRDAASRLKVPLYLVGGAIRDLLLRGELIELDLDLVTEGDASALAKEVAHQLQGELTTHPRFLTAEVVLGGMHLDFVTARGERYEEPASLPVVSPADLETDLARRDFSVNSMAVPLWPPGPGELIDPFAGRHDLERGQLRVLHERSFFDDPTRILRGVRIGARLDLHFTEHTADLARAAIGADAFAPLSATRLRHELILLLEDRQVELSLRRLEDLGFPAVVGRQTPFSDSDWQKLRRVLNLHEEWASDCFAREATRWWFVSLMSVSCEEDKSSREILAHRLGLDEQLSEILEGYPQNLHQVSGILSAADVAPHDVCGALEGLQMEELALLAATEEGRVATWISRWMDELRYLGLMIDGTDLKRAGFSAGPEMGRALQSTLEARQDGAIEAAEELSYAIRQLTRESG